VRGMQRVLGVLVAEKNMKPDEAPSTDSETFTTGEMARRSGNTLRTVRFYEEAGILQPLGRTVGGHRVFSPSQLERLLLVSDMREAGLSLEEIRTLLEMKDRAKSGGDAAKHAIAALEGHLGGLRRKMAVLDRLAADIEQTTAAANACLGCERTDISPDTCSTCGRVGTRGELPRGMRVLWSIGTSASSSESAPRDPEARP
jgi:MerR family Zn(II)-responsive transcriptional regulator of zntA